MEETKYYAISGSSRNGAIIEELTVVTESDRFIVLDGKSRRYSVDKREIKYCWDDETLITDDLEDGKIRWNEHMDRQIEMSKNLIKYYKKNRILKGDE